MVSTDVMEARYGRSRRARGDRRIFVVLAAVLLVGLIGFLVWAAFGAKPTIQGQVDSFKVVTNHSVSVAVTVTNPTGHRAKCQVSATMPNGSSVGSKEIAVDGAATSAQDLEIATVEPANGAIVDVCWTY